MTVALSSFGNDLPTARERIEVRAKVVNVDGLGTLQIIHNSICDRLLVARRNDVLAFYH